MNPSKHQTPPTDEEVDEEGEEERIQVEEIKDKQTNNLELRLGIPSSNNSSFIFKENMSFSSCANIGLLMAEPPPGFIDPWSLAARQQKAVLEQAHKKTTNPSSSSTTSQDLQRGLQPPSPSIVGWPPVCAFRRNMASSQGTRPEIECERQAKRAKIGEEEGFNGLMEDVKGAAIFVKVNMDGYAVGRKIDLRAHSSYDSLSHSLRKMFRNFLSLDYPISEELVGETLNRDYLLLYEDHEGDRMLVGDVPWEMFITSVKRLYIVRSPKSQRPAENHVTSAASMDAKEYDN